MPNNICLLLTSTIEMKDKSLLRRSDTQVRLNDYKASLKKWLTRQKSLSKIVFVDNSGYPLDELRKVVFKNNPFNKRIEFLSFIASEKENSDTSRGEQGAIDFALKNSELLKEAEYFVKVTGRVFVVNIDKILKNIPDYFHVIASLTDNLLYMRSMILIFNKDFHIRKIAPYARENIDSRNRMDFERVYAKALHLALEQDYRWFPFYAEPIIDGFSGAKNRSYRRGRLRSLMLTLCSRAYHRFYRNSYGKKQKHMLEKWNIMPKT